MSFRELIHCMLEGVGIDALCLNLGRVSQAQIGRKFIKRKVINDAGDQFVLNFGDDKFLDKYLPAFLQRARQARQNCVASVQCFRNFGVVVAPGSNAQYPVLLDKGLFETEMTGAVTGPVYPKPHTKKRERSNKSANARLILGSMAYKHKAHAASLLRHIVCRIMLSLVVLRAKTSSEHRSIG